MRIAADCACEPVCTSQNKALEERERRANQRANDATRTADELKNQLQQKEQELFL